MKEKKYFLYRLIQCTWGFAQTAAGLIVRLKFRKCRGEWYKGAYVTWWPGYGGVSLGMFIFVGDKLVDPQREQVLVHEYGHTWQSLFLGPSYLLLVGIPSFFWANLPACRKLRSEKGVRYTSRYPEKWASRLGERRTGRPADWH